MATFANRLSALIVKLHEINALKFGDFKMKVGINSPVYFDLRVIVSFPEVMDMLSKLLWEFCKTDVECDHLCGVPYTALPIASLISVHAIIPMLIRRKEAKDYGTRKLIEGKFKNGDKCVIIEDVVTSGSSILETYRDLKNEGLNVTEAIVVVDRQQGGKANLSQHGLKMRSLITLSQIMNILLEQGRVSQTTVDQVRLYIETTQIPLNNYLSFPQAPLNKRLTADFLNRAIDAKSPVTVKLFNLMAKKRTNLCLSADLVTCSEILKFADLVGEHICLLKVHADIIKDFDAEFVEKLTGIAKEKNFLIMEDRKFGDIGYITSLQYSEGVHKIMSWADLVTVHPIAGPGIVDGLVSALKKNPTSLQRGCFLVVEMSSQGNLSNSQYTAGAMKIAEAHPDFVVGVVCQTSSTLTIPGLLQLTPGVQLIKGGDSLGQQYNSPSRVMLELGADIAVVGRGITEAPNASEVAAEFRSRLWEAYEKRISGNN